MASRMRGILGAAVLLLTSATAIAACSQSDELIMSPAHNPEVDKATADALATLPAFWARFDAKPAGIEAYFLKVAMPARGGGVEHIWMEVIDREGGRIRARVANDPVAIEGLSAGDQVQVDPAHISDWSYIKNGKMFGHYTTRALMDRANPDQQQEALTVLSATPTEAESN